MPADSSTGDVRHDDTCNLFDLRITRRVRRVISSAVFLVAGRIGQ